MILRRAEKAVLLSAIFSIATLRVGVAWVFNAALASSTRQFLGRRNVRETRVTAIRMESKLKDTATSRAQLLRLLPSGLLSAAVISAASKPSFAAIPTVEDYAVGTGSKLKRTRIEDDLSAPLPKSAVNPNNPMEVVGAMSGELGRMQALVKKERWGDALTRLRSFPLTALKSPTLGLKSVGDVGRALGVDSSKASEILEASVEAGLTLKQVEEIVFSNTRTLEFYNSADLKQVQDLAKDTTPTDLTESLQLLSDTEQLVNDVKKLMEGATTATATNVQ